LSNSEALNANVSLSGPETKASPRRSPSFVSVPLPLATQCLRLGVFVTKLITPADAVRPPSVDCGPFSTSTRMRSVSSFAAVESDGTGMPSIINETPEVRPTAASFAFVEMPRIAIGTRPLNEPFSSTEGTSVFSDEISVTLALAMASADSTAAATGVSFSRSVRFCALITTVWGWSLPPVASDAAGAGAGAVVGVASAGAAAGAEAASAGGVAACADACVAAHDIRRRAARATGVRVG